MKIEVISPDSTLFSGEVEQATLLTHIGEISILPDHMPLVSIIKPGLLSILPSNPEQYKTKAFTINQEKITISVGSGIAYTDGQNIKLVVQSGDLGTTQSQEELEEKLTHRTNIYEKAVQESDQETMINAKTQKETIASHLALQKANKE